NALVRFAHITPELTRRDTHGVEMLRILAQPVRIRIREDVCPMMRGNNTVLSSSISRQPRVAVGVQIPSHNAITYSEARLSSNCSRHRVACAQKGSDLFRSYRVCAAWHREVGVHCELLDLGFDFLSRNRAACDDSVLNSCQPAFVVARG